MKIRNKRLFYLISFLILFLTEAFIACFVHDRFVRPYIGDALVVIVLYCLIRTFLPEAFRRLPLYLFLFAATVEILQYFDLPGLLGMGENRLARIILGSTFDWMDIVCYGIGCLILGGYEWYINKLAD